MKAILVRGSDGLPSAEISGMEIPSFKSGEVLVQMVYASINPSDIVYAKGQYGIKARLPFVPGLEGTGMVIDGKGYGKLLVGRRVACTSTPGKSGSWANYMVTEASRCVPLMKNLTWEEGATLLINPLTAWGLWEKAQNLKADAVVVSQSSGALGHMLVRLGRERGIPTMGLTRSYRGILSWPEEERNDIFHMDDALQKEILKEKLSKFRKIVIMDGNGGKSSSDLLQLCPNNTSLIIYGAMDREVLAIPPVDYIFRNFSVEGFWLKNYIAENRGISIAYRAFQIQRYIKDALRTKIAGIRPMEDFYAAVSEYKKDMAGGKILLNVEA